MSYLLETALLYLTKHHRLTFMPSIQVSIASGTVRIPCPQTSTNDINHPAALAQISTDTLSQLLNMFTSVIGT